MSRYRIRFATKAEMVAEVSAVDEEAAYDLAVALIKERLDEISVHVRGVSVHADIDGLDAEDVEELTASVPDVPTPTQEQQP